MRASFDLIRASGAKNLVLVRTTSESSGPFRPSRESSKGCTSRVGVPLDSFPILVTLVLSRYLENYAPIYSLDRESDVKNYLHRDDPSLLFSRYLRLSSLFLRTLFQTMTEAKENGVVLILVPLKSLMGDQVRKAGLNFVF